VVAFASIPLLLLPYLFLAGGSAKCCQRRPVRVVPLLGSPLQVPIPLAAPGDEEDDGRDALSLAAHYRENRLIRIGMPFLCLAGMALGAWTVTIPAVDMRLHVVGGVVDTHKLVADDSVLVYSFPEMVHDFWHSKAYFIASLLAVGGLALPQVKGFVWLYVWAASMSSEQREQILIISDLFSRFIFVNSCFMALIITTLHFQFSLQGLELEVVAEPAIAVVTGVLQAVLLTVHGQVTLRLHGLAASRPERDVDATCNVPGRLAAACAVAGSVPRGVAVAGFAAACTASVCLAMVFAHDVLVFDISGLVGVALESPISRTSPKTYDWLPTLPGRVMASTDEKVVAGLVIFLFLMAVVVGPILCCLNWLFFWGSCVLRGEVPFGHGIAEDAPTLPLQPWPRAVRWAGGLSPWLFSWFGLDALWAAAWSATLEMDLVAQWLVRAKTGNLCDDIQDHLGKPCVRLEGTLLTGGWFLLFGGILSVFLFLLTANFFVYGTFEPRAAKLARRCGLSP